MPVSCAKGHVNDDTNRFCDQCGLPLGAAPAVAPQEVTFVSMPAAGASSVVCPVCGQENVPGTAFCDNCGAVLPPPQPAVEQSDGSSAAPGPIDGAVPVAQAQTDAVTVVCPNCGTTNDAVNRFCENCGAALAPAEAGEGGAANGGEPAQGVTVVEEQEIVVAQDESAPAAAVGEAEAPAPAVGEAAAPAAPSDQPLQDSAPPIAAQGDSVLMDAATADAAATEQPLVDTVPEPGAEMGSVAVDNAAPAAPEAEAAPAAEAPATPTADVDAERTRIQGQIDTQRRLVEQLEGMQQTFGAATPAAITQGLDEARAALSRAEQELEQLAPAAPAVDPAEVARLEGEIDTQRRLVEQLEGMQQTFGAATPAAILQGLDEARAALSRAEQELADLTGTPIAQAPASDAADVPAPAAEAQQPPAEFAPPAVESAAPAAAAPAPEPETAVPAAPAAAAVPETTAPTASPAQAPVSGPRFVDRDGVVLSFASGTGELVIGREDPVSGIHPDIDLTPHGGEAGGVSRRHALLRDDGGQWTISDLDSTNYTRVDGSRIAPNTPTPLRDGARVQFGRVEFEFRAS